MLDFDPSIAVLLGDVWSQRRARDWIVIPTNIGWRQDGSNPMGKGLARKAAQKYKPLPAWYGALCRQHMNNTPTLAHPHWNLILFPTKSLDARRPWASWQQPASLELIQRSLGHLSAVMPHLPRGGRVLLPAVGCGEGGLDPAEIVPILLDYQAREERVRIVLLPETAAKVQCPLCQATGGGCQYCRDSGTLLPEGWKEFDGDDPFGLFSNGGRSTPTAAADDNRYAMDDAVRDGDYDDGHDHWKLLESL